MGIQNWNQGSQQVRVLRSITVVLIAIFGIGVFAASASAVEVKITGGPKTDADLKAGGHPDLFLKIAFSGFDDPVNADIDLPAGFIGDSSATKAICTQDQLQANNCPADSQVGTALAVADAELTGDLAQPAILALLQIIGALTGKDPLHLEIPGKIYNVEPDPGRPAALGAVLVSPLSAPPLIDTPPIITVANFKLRTPGVGDIDANRGDYGLTNELRNLPTEASLNSFGAKAKVHLRSFEYTFLGTKGPNNNYVKPFTIMPTKCVPMSFLARAEGADSRPAGDTENKPPYAWGPDGSLTFTPKQCDKVPFEPKQTVKPFDAPAETAPDGPAAKFKASKPTGVTVELTVPGPDAAGSTAQSMVKRARVFMPEGIALSAGVGGKNGTGLDACTDEQFGLKSAGEPTCPALSKVGTVSFLSPIVPELKGDVYVGQSTSDALLREFMYVKNEASGIEVKLVGKTIPDPKTGKLETILDGLPEQPFKSFKLNFRGGSNAVLKGPDVCGDSTDYGYLETFTGPTETNPTGIKKIEATITTDGCKTGPKPFAPTLVAENGSNVAGADTTLRTIISRTDDDQLLKGTNVSLPPGALGRLAAVPQCSVAQVKADAEKCPADSLIGSVGVEAGTGDGTTELKGGKVYLTEGIDGSVAGLGIVVNAKVGPVDLGKSVIIGKMNARADLGIDLEVAETPTIVNGVPLYLRKMDILINKPGFLFNASSCAPAEIKVGFTSQEGATASATAPYNLTDCDKLKFDPQMTARLTGNAKTPGFTTQVRGTDGESTLKDTELTLPAGLSVAGLAALKNSCPKADYDAGNCKESNVVGDVRAETSLLPLPLTGPVTLLSLPGDPLPALGVKLRGAINFDLIVLNRVEKNARLTSVIAGVPDSPISNFQLNLKPDSLLAGSKTLCSDPQTAEGKFTAYSGAVSSKSVTVDTSAVCGNVGPESVAIKATLKGTKKGKKPALRVSLTGKNNPRITSAKVTLPSTLKIVRRELGGNARAVLAGVAAKDLTLSGRSLSVKAAKAGDKSIVMTIDNGALKNAGVKVGKVVKLKVSYTQAGSTKVRTITVSVRAAK